jgi:hypothetical protein
MPLGSSMTETGRTARSVGRESMAMPTAIDRYEGEWMAIQYQVW